MDEVFDSLSISTFEFAIIELKLVTETVLLVAIYRPPNTNVKKFIQEYESCIKKLDKFRGKTIICTDYNLDHLKLDMHKHTETFVDMNLEHDLYLCIMKPTRITKKSATLIDSIFVSGKHLILYNDS